MYTICWTNNEGIDHWTRAETREEAAQYLTENNLAGDEDVLVFGPEADDCLMDPDDLF